MRVLTLRAAATLLSQANSLRALRAIARVMGFHEARPLDREALLALHLTDHVQSAEFARGLGRRRCLLTVLTTPTTESSERRPNDARELARQLTIALAKNAPGRDWCVIALDQTLQHLSITIVAPENPARVHALRVDRRRVVDSDAETLRSLASVQESLPTLHHARIADILGRDALSHRFYRALELRVSTLASTASGRADLATKRELALTCASRCLFLAFLEAKGWLNQDRQFLLHHTTRHLERDHQLYHSFFKPLFFGTLNTPRRQRATRAREFGEVPFLNGGLFAPTPLERRHRDVRFSNDALAGFVIDLLDRYRFTAREDSLRWSEASIDPEMLGRAFESLMAATERHATGSYYTPPTLVETVVRDALHSALPLLPPSAFAHPEVPLTLTPDALRQLHNVRVIDPACGSGACLGYTLEALATLRSRAGDARPVHEVRRETLAHSIFGVDRNPMAVWLCELRLWLSIVIECPESRINFIPPLPNLDHHIRLGDTLAGGDFQFAPPSARQLARLRLRYVNATGLRKHTLAAALEREERERAEQESQRIADRAHFERGEAIAAVRSRDLFGQRPPRTRVNRQALDRLRQQHRDATRQLARIRLGGALPFRFAAQFADVAAEGGFSLVIGNPPWVRPHALPAAERVRLRAEFRTMRDAAWHVGATRAGAGVGFAAQADLAAAFVERSVQLLAPHGVAALLVPAKLWRALAGGGLRAWILRQATVHHLRDWSEAPALFDAAVYPSLIVARRRTRPRDDVASRHPRRELVLEPVPGASAFAQEQNDAPVRVNISNAASDRSFEIAPSELSLDGDPAAPWILLPNDARHALRALQRAGPPLGDSALGRPTLGVKLGFNAAFLVDASEPDTERDREQDDELAHVAAHDRRGYIERRMLRPVLRGDSVFPRAQKGQTSTNPCVIWTHDAQFLPLRALPPRTARWLANWRSQLERRRDARTKQPWWTLFRTDAARSELPRVVWADIGKQLRPRVLPAGDPTVPLNTCYVLRAQTIDDAWALCALLASPVADAWFHALAEPARGGFRRYLGWTVATLPVPRDWIHARPPLAGIGREIAAGRAPSSQDYVSALARAYEVDADRLYPLVHWSLK